MNRLLGAAALLVGLVTGFATLVGTPTIVQAGCVAGIGCTDGRPISNGALLDATCGDLWYLRNSAYADNGYCFRSARGRRAFGNGGCSFSNARDVPLSRNERTNIGRIKAIEQRRGCR